jgi:hypothetical protein
VLDDCRSLLGLDKDLPGGSWTTATKMSIAVEVQVFEVTGFSDCSTVQAVSSFPSKDQWSPVKAT